MTAPVRGDGGWWRADPAGAWQWVPDAALAPAVLPKPRRRWPWAVLAGGVLMAGSAVIVIADRQSDNRGDCYAALAEHPLTAGNAEDPLPGPCQAFYAKRGDAGLLEMAYVMSVISLQDVLGDDDAFHDAASVGWASCAASTQRNMSRNELQDEMVRRGNPQLSVNRVVSEALETLCPERAP